MQLWRVLQAQHVPSSKRAYTDFSEPQLVHEAGTLPENWLPSMLRFFMLGNCSGQFSLSPSDSALLFTCTRQPRHQLQAWCTCWREPGSPADTSTHAQLHAHQSVLQHAAGGVSAPHLQATA